MTEFEWDEDKRTANLAKHGLDFAEAVLLFDEPHAVVPARTVAGEPRSFAVGMLLGRCVTIVFTERAGAIRLISMRRARTNERREYEAQTRPLHRG